MVMVVVAMEAAMMATMMMMMIMMKIDATLTTNYGVYSCTHLCGIGGSTCITTTYFWTFVYVQFYNNDSY